MMRMTETQPTVRHNTKALIDGHRFCFGSVRGYAAEYDEDQDAAFELAVERGHDTVWVNPVAAFVCDSPSYYAEVKKEWEGAPEFNTGDVVEFEGNAYRIEMDHNQNRKLTGVTITDR